MGLRGSVGLQSTRLNNRSVTYRSVHEKGVYFSKTATAFTQKFWMKVKPVMFHIAIFVFQGFEQL